MRRRWPFLPILLGVLLFLATTAASPPAGTGDDGDASPRWTGVLESHASPIDIQSMVLTVDGRTVYTADLDWHLYPGSVFEVEWLNEDHTAAAWTYRQDPGRPSVSGDEIRMEFRDHRGRVYTSEDPEESTGVFRAAAGPILEITNALVYPNPFNPFTDDATIQFDLSMDAEVEIIAYDWAGDFVATIYEGPGISGTNDTVEWGGQTEDGRKLGNGVYLIRILASTQARTESEVLKAVIWNEE